MGCLQTKVAGFGNSEPFMRQDSPTPEIPSILTCLGPSFGPKPVICVPAAVAEWAFRATHAPTWNHSSDFRKDRVPALLKMQIQMNSATAYPLFTNPCPHVLLVMRFEKQECLPSRYQITLIFVPELCRTVSRPPVFMGCHFQPSLCNSVVSGMARSST